MLKRIELILIVLAILAINLHLLVWTGSTIFTVLSFSGLALLYPFLSMALFLDESEKVNFNKAIFGMPFSIALIGILFKLQSWPGYEVNLMVGSISLAALIIHRYTLKNKMQQLNFKILSRRAIPLLVITLFMLALPKYAWIETKYSEYPEYIEAIKAYDKNPDSKALKHKLDSLFYHQIN